MNAFNLVQQETNMPAVVRPRLYDSRTEERTERSRPTPLSPEIFYGLMCAGAVVLDLRTSGEFQAGHIRNAFNIPLARAFATRALFVLPSPAPIVLVGNDCGQCCEAARQLADLGFDDVRGYLDLGMRAWQVGGMPLERSEAVALQEAA